MPNAADFLLAQVFPDQLSQFGNYEIKRVEVLFIESWSFSSAKAYVNGRKMCSKEQLIIKKTILCILLNKPESHHLFLLHMSF